ncbi:hypothetical protein [Parasediminibacterium sp. JCM 36343]|uniref:hypothetical protein n=1 Tax=Parasediminibacterium sp. JCM 36343 TaxID=3374279 RepID=UPI00397AD11B
METNIFSKSFWKGYIGFGFVAALLYASITASVIAGVHQSENTWQLYIGNAAFAGVVLLYVWLKRFTIPTGSLKVIAGAIVTAMGVFFSCLLLLLALALMPLQPFASANTPVTNPLDSNSGQVWNIFINAIMVNFLWGAITAAVFGLALQRPQAKLSAGNE